MRVPNDIRMVWDAQQAVPIDAGKLWDNGSDVRPTT
jgi:hypothetical protein